MARKKAEPAVEYTTEESDNILNNALDELSEINPDSSFLSESSLSNVKDWIDTGSYALNGIISGNIFGGIPVGRVTGIVGPSGTGKTLIMTKIMANAIKKGYIPIYFDSENALDSITAQRLGCDISKIKHMPIEFVEDCKNQIATILTKLIEKNLKRKVIIIIDSLGNLLTRKELEDSLENKSAMDMGLKAKMIGSLLRMATTRAAKAEIPIVFSNHIYSSPQEMYPSVVKIQSGGLKPLYISSVILQLSTTNEKVDEKTTAANMSQKFSGINLKALTTKNRFVVPFLETNMYLNFKTGLSPYKGLLDMAKNCGIIQQTGPTYVMDGQKLGFASSFEDSKEFWENHPLKPLQKLNDALQSDSAYSTLKTETTYPTVEE